MITATEIVKYYGELQVLKGINLEIKDSEIVSIVGDSGAGKTTLLQILGTLDSSTKGKILYDGVDVQALKPKALADFRNTNIGFIFQFHQLLPEFTCLE
jgi:lipoprotein-releasing system ATP-binding protein